MTTSVKKLVRIFFAVTILISIASSKKKTGEDKPAWAKKDIRDYNDVDIERLYDQWEEDDDPLEPDELPEHLRPSPKVDFSNLDPSNPEALLKMSKKGKTLMSFVSLTGNPSKEELEDISKLWQSSLMNNHIQSERYVVDNNRVIFMFKDGAQAWDAKEFLVQQERCEEVVIENKSYYGINSTKGNADKKTENPQRQTDSKKQEL